MVPVGVLVGVLAPLLRPDADALEAWVRVRVRVRFGVRVRVRSRFRVRVP